MTTTPLPSKPTGKLAFAYQTIVSLEQARADLEAENKRLREALERAELFIDAVRQDLHHERIADWYPEGAHSSAAAMSESMRVIGNRCADFEAESALERKP